MACKYRNIIIEQGKKQKDISTVVRKLADVLYKIEADNFMIVDELIKEVGGNYPMSIRSAILLMKCEDLIEESGLGARKIIRLTEEGRIFFKQRKLT